MLADLDVLAFSVGSALDGLLLVLAAGLADSLLLFISSHKSTTFFSVSSEVVSVLGVCFGNLVDIDLKSMFV